MYTVQPAPQALRFLHGRSERETLMTGDEPQGTTGRIQTGGEGCLPFIRAKRSVHKWYAKFRPDKSCPGNAFTVCTNQFHFPKNDREGLNPVSKMALKKWNTNFSLEYSVRKNRTTVKIRIQEHVD